MNLFAVFKKVDKKNSSQKIVFSGEDSDCFLPFPSIKEEYLKKRGGIELREDLDKTIHVTKKKEFRYIFLLSSSVFLLISLLFQFFINLLMASSLRLFSLGFIYRILDIRFYSISAAAWSLPRILFVFGFGTTISFFIGLLILNLRFKDWRLRLAASWSSFFMILYLPLSMVGGILLFQGFGMAFQWIIPNIYVRILVSSLAIVIAIIFRPIWISQFLKTAYSATFFDNDQIKKKYIRYVFIYPWVVNSLLLVIFFAIPLRAWLWAVYLLGLGVVVLPVFSSEIPLMPIRIYKTNNRVFAFKRIILLYFGILLLLWVISRLQIFF